MEGLCRSDAMTNCQQPILQRVESTTGMKEGWGLLYQPTSAKVVTRWAFGFFTKKEGLMYSKGKSHLF